MWLNSNAYLNLSIECPGHWRQDERQQKSAIITIVINKVICAVRLQDTGKCFEDEFLLVYHIIVRGTVVMGICLHQLNHQIFAEKHIEFKVAQTALHMWFLTL